MTEAKDILNNKLFLKRVEKMWESRKVSLMTEKTHPKIMGLYSRLCKEKKIKEWPIVLVESDEENANADNIFKLITISSAFLKANSALEVCFALGHEGGHMDKYLFRLMAPASLGVILPAFLPTSNIPSIILSEIAGCAAALKIHFYSEEYHNDIIGAKLAGKEAAISFLQKTDDKESLSLKERIHNIIFDHHPSNSNRIRHIERKFKDNSEHMR